MRVYIAGSWAQKSWLHSAHTYVRRHGAPELKVVSTWTTQPDGDYETSCLGELAQKDWDELRSADALIYMQLGCVSEGKATELGGALMVGKRIILVGERKGNVFLHLPIIDQVGSLRDAIRTLRTDRTHRTLVE